MSQQTTTNNALTYEQQIKAMKLAPEVERKMLKAIGVEVETPLFETYTYSAPDGKNVPMMKIKGVSKAIGGKAIAAIATNPLEFFSFVNENSEYFGVKFTPELIAAIDLLTGSTKE